MNHTTWSEPSLCFPTGEHWHSLMYMYISDETFYAQSQIMVENVPAPPDEGREILPKIRVHFPPLFDSVRRMFRQKLCFQSPKTFTPKYMYIVVNLLEQ